MIKGITADPLCWPVGRKRTRNPQQSRFDTTLGKARDYLFQEIGRAGGSQPILSTNLRLRNDGLPYSQQRQPDDRGVAVYFMRGGKQFVFSCDRWQKIEDNMHAISKTIEAIRGIERWGSGDAVEQAYSGFAALPAPDRKRSWREVLGISPEASVTAQIVRDVFRTRALTRHPDTGGSAEAMAELNAARDEALRAIGEAA